MRTPPRVLAEAEDRVVDPLRRVVAAAPLPRALRLPGTVVLPGPVHRAVRLPLTSRRRRAAVLRRSAALAVPVAAVAAGYAVVVRRPSGGDVVARMTHREASPENGTDREALPPVVLVHGLGMSSSSLARLVRVLGRSTRTLAPDLPGYGRSPQPREGMLDVQQLGEAVVAWMRRVDVGPAVLVGHSLGSQVVAEVALRAPELVRRLVVVAPTGDPALPKVRWLAGHLAADALRERPTIWGVAAVDYLRAGPGQMVALMRRALVRAQQEVDARLDVPVLVLRGDQDPVCRTEWCEQLAAALPDGRYVEVTGAHGVAHDAGPDLVRLLLDEARAAVRDR